MIEKEQEAIRETDLEEHLDTIHDAVIVVAGRRDPFREDVQEDKMGRIHLSAKFVGKKVTHLNVGPGAGHLAKVVKTEDRFKGEQPSKVVCYLEDR